MFLFGVANERPCTIYDLEHRDDQVRLAEAQRHVSTDCLSVPSLAANLFL